MSAGICYYAIMRVFIQSLISISNTKFLVIVFLFSLFLFLSYFEIFYRWFIIIAIIGLIIESIHFGAYLSEIIINENDVVLVQKKFWHMSYIQIYKSDISAFQVELQVRGEKKSLLSLCKVLITVKTINNRLYHFDVEPVMNLNFCDYEIFFKLLDISPAIPNFSKNLDITGNGEVFKAVKSRLKKQKNRLKS